MEPQTPPVASDVPAEGAALLAAPASAVAPTAPRATVWPAALLAIALFLVALPVALNMRAAADPLRFNDDVRQQIWPYLRFSDPHLFPEDKIADYYLACTPVGFKLLYAGLAKVVDPRTVSKALPYLLLLGLAAPAGIAASRLEGRWAGWATVGLCLGAPIFLGRMNGGLPRGFAFPLYALAAAALVSGRPLVLAVVVCLGAAFYQTVAVTCGLALATWLLLLPRQWRGAAIGWSLGRRVGMVAATALVTGLISLPGMLAMRQWGSLLRPADVAAFPEAGPGGRYHGEDLPQGLLSAQDLQSYVRASLAGIGGTADPEKSLLAQPVKHLPVWAFGALGIYGFATLAAREVRSRRLLLLGVAAVAAHVVSAPLAPYLFLPARYLTYPLAVLAAIVVPVGVATLPFRFAKASRVPAARSKTVAVVCGAFLLFLFFADGKSMRTAGLNHSALAHRRTYEYLQTLPAFTLVAGWPSDSDDVPYVAERPVLVSAETHQAFSRAYVELMRRRTNAVIDALFSPDAAAMERLRDDFGVSYLIVEQSPGTGPKGSPEDPDRWIYGPKVPTYFAPFNDRIVAARAALGDAKPAALAEIALAARFADGNWVVLDLDRLPGRTGNPFPRSATQPATQPSTRPSGMTVPRSGAN